MNKHISEHADDVGKQRLHPKPPRIFAPPWLGQRFTRGMRRRYTGLLAASPMNKAFVSTPTNKAFRRQSRRRLMRAGMDASVFGRGVTGRIDAQITAWRNDLVPHLRGKNSHAKKRELRKVDAWFDARRDKEAGELERMRANRRAILAGMRAQPKPVGASPPSAEWPPLNASPSGTP